jgi:TolB protein
LLNLGFRIPAGAGTDAMANFASLRGPVGMDRVYARLPEGPVSVAAFMEALKKGRTFATNGPLLDFSLGGQQVGGELRLNGPTSVSFTAKLRSLVPVDRFELVCGGRVVQSWPFSANRESAEIIGVVQLKESGWCALRTSSEKAEYPILDRYVYATTSPVYVTIGGKRPSSPGDAKYFVAWMDRVIERTSSYSDWNSRVEKESVLKRVKTAKTVFEQMQ